MFSLRVLSASISRATTSAATAEKKRRNVSRLFRLVFLGMDEHECYETFYYFLLLSHSKELFSIVKSLFVA